MCAESILVIHLFCWLTDTTGFLLCCFCLFVCFCRYCSFCLQTPLRRLLFGLRANRNDFLLVRPSCFCSFVLLACLLLLPSLLFLQAPVCCIQDEFLLHVSFSCFVLLSLCFRLFFALLCLLVYFCLLSPLLFLLAAP